MSTRNISCGGKGGRCVGLKILPPFCDDCREIWEPRSAGTFRTTPGLRAVQGFFALTFTIDATKAYTFLSNVTLIDLEGDTVWSGRYLQLYQWHTCFPYSMMLKYWSSRLLQIVNKQWLKQQAYLMYCNVMRNRLILIITMHKWTYEFTFVNR